MNAIYDDERTWKHNALVSVSVIDTSNKSLINDQSSRHTGEMVSDVDYQNNVLFNIWYWIIVVEAH